MRLGASLSLALSLLLQFHSIRPYYFSLFSVHPIKPYYWPRACQLNASLLPIKHTDAAATTLPPELLTHAFLSFFFLPPILTHSHTQMLPLTLSLSLLHKYSSCHILLLLEFIQMLNTDVQIVQYGNAIWRNLDMKHLHV